MFMTFWKADRVLTENIALGEVVGKRQNICVHWLLTVAFSKLLQDTNDGKE